MITGQHWDAFTSSTAARTVAPFAALRSSAAGDTLHYVQDDGAEFLAVRQEEPYGSGVPADVEAFGLLESIDNGFGFTVFAIPEDTLSLRALTLGTGHRRPDLLHEPYRRIGAAVHKAAAELALPLLEVSDVAFNRTTGAVLFLPPLALGRQKHDLGEHADAFVNSLSSAFSEHFFTDDFAGIAAQARAGILYGGSAS